MRSPVFVRALELTVPNNSWSNFAKGHSDDPGNERADELVQWGKGKGPTKQQYKRLDIDGGYEEPAPTAGATPQPPAISLEYYRQQCR